METWIIFSLMQSLTLATLYFIDKIIVSKFVKNPFQPLVMTGIIALMPVSIIYALGRVSNITYLQIIYCLGLGLLGVSLFFYYYKSMQSEEVSRFIPFSALANVLILFLAVLLLNERFGIYQYAGVMLLIIGAVLISIRLEKRLKWSVGLKYMAAYIILAAISSISQKYLLNSIDYFTVFFYVAIGTFIGTLPIIFTNGRALIGIAKDKGTKILYVMFFSETLGIFAVLLGFLAISSGPVSLVSAFSSFKLVFVFIFSIILSMFLPNLVKEEISTKIIIQKIAAIGLMVLGAFLIFSL